MEAGIHGANYILAAVAIFLVSLAVVVFLVW
jgi:hypothetical protein